MNIYNELSIVIDKIANHAKQTGFPVVTGTQLTNPLINPCSEIFLDTIYPNPNNWSLQFLPKVAMPKTEDEMLDLVNKKVLVIVEEASVRGKDRRVGRRPKKVVKHYLANVYLKKIKWFYEKYKLLFED